MWWWWWWWCAVPHPRQAKEARAPEDCRSSTPWHTSCTSGWMGSGKSPSWRSPRASACLDITPSTVKGAHGCINPCKAAEWSAYTEEVAAMGLWCHVCQRAFSNGFIWGVRNSGGRQRGAGWGELAAGKQSWISMPSSVIVALASSTGWQQGQQLCGLGGGRCGWNVSVCQLTHLLVKM